MEHDLGSEFTTMKERAMDQIIQDMGIQDVNINDSMLLKIESLEDQMIGSTPNNLSEGNNCIMAMSSSHGNLANI